MSRATRAVIAAQNGVIKFVSDTSEHFGNHVTVESNASVSSAHTRGRRLPLEISEQVARTTPVYPEGSRAPTALLTPPHGVGATLTRNGVTSVTIVRTATGLLLLAGALAVQADGVFGLKLLDEAMAAAAKSVASLAAQLPNPYPMVTGSILGLTDGVGTLGNLAVTGVGTAVNSFKNGTDARGRVRVPGRQAPLVNNVPYLSNAPLPLAGQHFGKAALTLVLTWVIGAVVDLSLSQNPLVLAVKYLFAHAIARMLAEMTITPAQGVTNAVRRRLHNPSGFEPVATGEDAPEGRRGHEIPMDDVGVVDTDSSGEELREEELARPGSEGAASRRLSDESTGQPPRVRPVPPARPDARGVASAPRPGGGRSLTDAANLSIRSTKVERTSPPTGKPAVPVLPSRGVSAYGPGSSTSFGLPPAGSGSGGSRTRVEVELDTTGSASGMSPLPGSGSLS